MSNGTWLAIALVASAAGIGGYAAGIAARRRKVLERLTAARRRSH